RLRWIMRSRADIDVRLSVPDRMKTVPSVLIAFAILAAGMQVARGQDGEVVFGVHTRGSISHFSLNHDASMLVPPPGFPMASYGNPTSVRSYEPLYAADIE